MSRPQYINRDGDSIVTSPPSLWERILGYKPRYLTPSDTGEDRPRVRRERRRSADETRNADD